MMALTKITTVVVLALIGGACLYGQTNVLDSDPIAARRRLVFSELGGYVGVGANSQGGTFTTSCNCEFSGGGGAGILVGAIFERLTRSTIVWGATLGYEGRSITSKFREIEGVVQRSPSGRDFTVPITFLHEADVQLGVVTLMPFVKYTFFEGIFGRLGGSVGYVFTSNLIHTKTLETTEVTFPNGETASVSLAGQTGSTVILEDGPVSELSALQIGLVPAVGMDIRISKKMFLSPIFQYMVPITTISAQGAGFSVRSFQFSLELRHIL
mgnify:CR=1 FL=1